MKNKIMRLKTLGTSTRADNFLQPSASFLSSSILANSIDDKSQLLQESSLNSWIRQQGVSLPKKRELPKLIERKNDLSFITTSSKSSTKQEKKSKLLPKLRGKSRNGDDWSSFRNKHTKLPQIETSKSFHLRCIDDVSQSNNPKDFKFVKPKELKYLHSLSNIKYSTYLINDKEILKYNIEMNYNRPIHLEEDSLADMLSINEKASTASKLRF